MPEGASPEGFGSSGWAGRGCAGRLGRAGGRGVVCCSEPCWPCGAPAGRGVVLGRLGAGGLLVGVKGAIRSGSTGRVLAVEPAGDVPLAALVFSSIFRCRALCFCCATLLRLFKS